VIVVCLIATAGYMIGIITGVLCKNSNMAIQTVPLLMMPIMTYGGQVVNLAELPWYSSWIQYFSPLRYGFNIIVKSQLQTPELLNLGRQS
jgi:ABC-type multidrug transport system permease subunit